MNRDLIEFYENKKQQLEKEIIECREADKNRMANSRTKRLYEIDLILAGLNAEKENNKLITIIRDLEKRLKQEGVVIDE